MAKQSSEFRTTYQKLAELLRNQIEEGVWGEDGRLPLHEELCTQLKVSRTTLSKAMNVLSQEGLISCRRGLGTYVVPKDQRWQNSRQMAVSVKSIAMFADISEPGIWPTLFDHVNDRARYHGYHTLLFNSGNEFSRFRDRLVEMRDANVQGILWGVLHCPNPEQVNRQICELLEEMKFPYVLVDSPLEGYEKADHVGCDNYKAMYDLTQYLISLGHQRLAFLIDEQTQILSAKQRLQGYLDCARDAGLPSGQVLVNDEILRRIMPVGDTFTKVIEVTLDQWLMRSDPPTAIICLHDLVAIRTIGVLLSRGVQVPQQMSVTGFDGAKFINVFYPKITTYRQDFRQESALAVDALIHKIERDAEFSIHENLTGELVIGQTTAPPASS